MTIEVRNTKISHLIDFGVDLEQVATGFQFTEGPIWHPTEKTLIFSDIPGNTLYRWSRVDGVTVFRTPSNKANGNAYDREGRILSCEHATSQVRRPTLDGTIETLATHYGDKELNSPNDIVVKLDGAIYFTDPPYGRTAVYGREREQQLNFQGVYRLDPKTNDLTLLVDDFARPNGLCFSLDERQLFVNDTERLHIRCFDVADDGTLTNGHLWAETTGEGHSAPDGMKIDQEGNVYSCGPGGIHIFDPEANCLGVIQMPEHTANLAFGDDDLRSLYITASTSVYRLRVKVQGHSTFAG
ncbi:SMP-30/gluconolactonase/LRE family protein [Chloroflexi bacterium TSY]|nr:SMP-30/gluconolactonase/LRE family protein [Chloroflexi bacterium TSY]